MERKTLLRNTFLTAAIMVAATGISFAFFHYSGNATGVAIVYVLAVMFVARYTQGYVPGIVASVIGVICVNYVFTYPYFQLNFSIDGYPLTFIGMMFISSVTSTLTTNLKKQNRLIHEREKLLMEAEKETMRANLLRAVSHDLRTPLTSIIGLADTYLERQKQLTEEEKSDMVGSISEDANWLLNMVENLLSITRIREAGTRVTTVPEPLEEVVSEAVRRFRKRMPDAGLNVRVPEEFLMIPMDAVLVEQVLLNLLENSVYHSAAEDPIQLFVERQGDIAAFHIRDFGKGISPERLESIFDGAGSGENESGDSHKGMGIGLTICKTIITAHGGEIWAVNRERGAEFIFTLPLGKDTRDDAKTNRTDH